MSRIHKVIKRGFRSTEHRIGNALAYIHGMTSFKTRIISDLKELNIKGVSFTPLNFNKWHNGTSFYVVTSRDGNKYFVKKSRNERNILNEVKAINFLNETNNEKGFQTCSILKYGVERRYSYVIESYIDGQQLSDVALIEGLSKCERIEILKKLYNIVVFFHSIDFVHSDFTPKNIIINGDSIAIIDFEFSYIPSCKQISLALRKDKIKDIGSKFGLGNGIADDGFSLMQISKYLEPELILVDHELWRAINLLIGNLQFDLYKQEIMKNLT